MINRDYSFLLNRPEHKFDELAINTALAGRRILVTGGGGSIGSAIARRLNASPAAFIGVVGHSEAPIFALRNSGWFDGRLETAIADVGDVATMRDLVERWAPDLIFHAAAHKHVGLMESQPHAAFHNNSLATIKLARVALESKSVRKFVFISTDKAACPTSVMGASKRVAEVSLRYHFSPFATVCRFGNVLGSSGSLVEIVERQIAEKKTVTINDPKMTRFFITAKEAVGLVLTAGLLEEGDGFLLAMGEPVSIVELVNKLCSKAGHTDIVHGTPGSGEKTDEDLRCPDERFVRTSNPAVFKITSEPNPKVDEVIARVALNPYSLVGEAATL